MMKKENNNRGFTLVELLVVVVILGIITLMSMPQISNLIDSNNNAKYETYAETIKTSAKLYTDSYNVDMFGNNTSGCYDISYDQLSDKKLIEDININNVTCSGGTQKKTFVRVYKSGNHYKYKVSILCTNEDNQSAIEYSNLISEDLESDTVFCDGKTMDADGPTISLNENGSTWTTGAGMKVRLTISDDYGLLENIKIRYAWTKTPTAVSESEWTSKNFTNARYDSQVSFELEVPQGKNEDYYLVVDPVMVRDANGNYQTTRFISNVFQFDNTAPTCTVAATASPTGLSNWYVVIPTIKMTYNDTRGEITSYGMETTNRSNANLVWNKKKEVTQSDTTGVTWYGYVKDAAGNVTKCNSGNIKVDTVVPTTPTSGKISVSGSSSNATLPSASGSTDATSGVKEYRYYVINNDSTKPAKTAAGFTTNKSFVRSCGTKYYAYAIAVDNAGNKSAVYSMGNASDGANSYSSWSTCTKTCGTGTQTRTNTCALVTNNLQQSCNTQDCCSQATTTYGNWSTCSKTCGTGTQSRTVTVTSDYTGNVCSTSTEKRNCNTQSCCSSTTTSYGSWGTCSKTCGTGTQSRTVKKYSTYDGSLCTSTTENQNCNTHSCCSATYIGGYGSWGGCSASCGGGTQYRDVYYYSSYTGEYCSTTYSGSSQSCNNHSCCSATYIGGYGSWGGCSASCGGGTQYRDVYYYSSYTGGYCSTSYSGSSQSCNTQSCCSTYRYSSSSAALTYCWNFAATYMGGGANWNNGKLSLCTGDGTGCVAATDSSCGKIGGTYFYFRYCP